MDSIKTLLKNNKAISWVLGFQLFRLILLPFMGLMPQDAYYYLYGQNTLIRCFYSINWNFESIETARMIIEHMLKHGQ